MLTAKPTAGSRHILGSLTRVTHVAHTMAELLTFTTVVSLAVTAVYAVASVAAGFHLGKNFPPVEKWIIAWLVFDALIHFTLVMV